MVITTYTVARMDWKRDLAEPTNSLSLYARKWSRVVLDEGRFLRSLATIADIIAHIIREPSKSFAKSVCALKADKRWAVTGTPIQNRLTDLYSLFKFIRCYPFDNREVLLAHVTENWKSKLDPACVAKLKTLINCLSLRRPKDTIELLPRRDCTIYLDFNEQERKDYDWVKGRANSSIDLDDQRRDGATYLHALRWVNELRLMCNHGKRSARATDLLEQTPPPWAGKEAQARFDEIDGAGQAICGNPECRQDLSSALSSEDEEKHDDEPWISEILDIWCSSCYQEKPKSTARVYRICNHLPRRLVQNTVQLDLEPSSAQATQQPAVIPTKVRRVVQDLVETSNDTKRFVLSPAPSHF